METILVAELMVLGIFVGIPALIGLAIAGGIARGTARTRKAEQARAVEAAAATLDKAKVK